MKILVCLKQVPDRESLIEIDENGRGGFRLPGQVRAWVNHFDEFAVEEAVRLKEKRPATEVDALTIGPESAAAVLERAVGMGADRGVHILAGDEGYRSPLVTARWMAAYAVKQNYDLILTGAMAEDDTQAQTGPMLAELLDMSWATFAVSLQVALNGLTATALREVENGFQEEVFLSLPAVVTVQTGINKPRYPSLSNILRARKEKPETIRAEDLPLAEAGEELVAVRRPGRTRAGIMLEGASRDKAVRLVEILKGKGLWP